MQKKNKRSYTFLLSHKTKTKVYIRRIEISKNLFHTALVGLFIAAGIISLGFFKNTALAEFDAKSQTAAAIAVENARSKPTNSVADYKSINYARPESSSEYVLSSDETVISLKPFPLETDADKSQMESQLRAIENTSNPSFLPTMWAHLGKINNEFGFRRNPFGGRSYEFHAGLDIDGERGDVVAVPANGIVTETGWKGGYGNMIEVDHGNGLKTRYGHLSKIGVQAGDAVQRGQLIGLIGSTGRSTGPHLHYELRLNDKPINPRRFLPTEKLETARLNGY